MDLDETSHTAVGEYCYADMQRHKSVGTISRRLRAKIWKPRDYTLCVHCRQDIEKLTRHVNQQQVNVIRERKSHKLCSKVNLSFHNVETWVKNSITLPLACFVNEASINVVAQYFNVHHNTISRLQPRLHHSGTVCNRQRSGQTGVTTPAQDSYIHPLHPKKLCS